MKKAMIYILSMCMFVMMFAGCTGGIESTTQPSEAADVGPEETDTETEAPASPSSDKKVTLRFATQAMDQETSVLYSVLQQFQKDYPNVKLEIEETPGNDLIQKINTDIMGGNTPDLFTFWRPEAKWSVDKYIGKGALADLTELVDTDPFFDGLFPEFAWKTATVDGKVYCIPRNSFYVEFLVNKKLFEEQGVELPTDWEKLVTACEHMDANGIIPWAVDTKEGLDDSSRVFNAVINRAVGNDKGLELLKGEESFQQEDVLRALGYFLEVCQGYAPEDAAVLDFNQVIAKYLNTGQAGMLLGNASQVDVNLTDEILDDLVALDFPLTPVSVIDAPSTEQDLTNLVYMSAEAYDNPDKQEYVVELLKRIVDRDTAKRMVEEERMIIPHLNVDIDDTKVSQLQKSAAALAEKAPGDKWLLSFAKPGPVDEFRIVINQAWAGQYSSADELAVALDDALYQK